MNWMTLSLSLVPIAALVVALSVFKAKAYKATAGAAGLALVLALAFFRSAFPATEILPTVADGVSFALYPICLVVLAALFVYSLTVESGALKKIREGLSEVSPDPRVLAILVVWGFGNFMEGMAGFGTAVAIPAAILVGVGFDPLKSVLICLVANTTPTAFGSVGVPLVTLSKVGGTDLATLAKTAVFLQLFVTALGPFLILLVLDGWKGLRGAVRLALMADAAFLVPWFLSARLLGPELPDILGGLSVLIVVSLWERKGRLACDLKAQVKAWAPFGFVALFLGVAALLPAAAKRYAPSGVLILLAGFLGGVSQGLSFGRMCRVLKKTLVSYWTAFATIVFVLVLARVMTVSGMVATLADSLVAATGTAYPFFAPVVGALGGFVTGSGTSACVLFGPLQAGAAAKLGVAPDLLAAANVMGAGIGKMICPQSVAIGTAAALVADRAGDAFKRMLPWFFAVLLLACLVVHISAQW